MKNKGIKKMVDTRRKLRITQSDLSEKTGIKRTTIASIEAGFNRPSVKNAKILAKFLGFKWELFFEEEE